jgi:hypothetical protein
MCRTIVALLFLVTGTFAGIGETTAQQAADGRRTVGIISSIGETFTLQRIGLMVFGNEKAATPIDGWAIDENVAGKIGTLLGKRFLVKKINFPRGTFSEVEEAAQLRDRVRNIAAAQKCDLYLVVSRAASRFGTSNQVVEGLGLVENSGLFGTVNLHALSVISILDGRTFEVLREMRSTIGQSTFMADIQGPHQDVGASAWPKSGNVTHNGPLRTATWSLVEQSLAMTIPELLQTN